MGLLPLRAGRGTYTGQRGVAGRSVAVRCPEGGIVGGSLPPIMFRAPVRGGAFLSSVC